jgi:glycosyltransferase involved in cell wall biosynthesis
VMIPTYNCARYLRETLESVLAQDPGPEMMQIEVVDDCSTTDDPEAVVKELGRGRVTFHRQPANVGHVGNFNTCLIRARGEIVHILHGDDLVSEGFYTCFQDAFERDARVGAACCSSIFIDGDGLSCGNEKPIQSTPGILDHAAVRIARNPPYTPSVVVRRQVYENLGGFDSRFRWCGEDLEMWVRIAANHPVWYHPEPLAVYRVHHGLTGKSVKTGGNVQDVKLAQEIYQSYLPPHSVAEVMRSVRDSTAIWALKRARRAYMEGDFNAARVQIKEALKTSRAPSVIARLARMTLTLPVRRILLRLKRQ